ncbi:MAG: PLDc N-terminal domain-containing protein [Ilumatobacteraceae bacterium]
MTERVADLLAGFGSRLDLADDRADPEQIEVVFTGQLRPQQAAAVDDVVDHDRGVLVAPPGAGKTVMACAVIAPTGHRPWCWSTARGASAKTFGAYGSPPMSLISVIQALAAHPALAPVLAPVSDDDEGFGTGAAVLLAVIVIALVVLFIAALVSIVRTSRLSGGGKLLWVVIVFVFPLIGSIVWFAFGRGMNLDRN